MAHFPLDGRVAVRPFAHHRDGQSATIGDLSRQVFLTIPADGLDILSALAAGKTVRETVQLYEREHAVTPDVQDFLAALAGEGFIAPWDEQLPPVANQLGSEEATGRISPTVARRIGAPALGICAITIALGSALLATDPELVPGSTALVFHDHLAALVGALFAVTIVGVVVHELAHVLAARSSGVTVRIGISHRLWIIVAETDMTGIWMASKRHRYLAFLAGPIIDAASAAVLIAVLWAQRRGWIALSGTAQQFTGAVLWSYLLRLLWQCFIVVRTDFYYVLATALDCKNLLADTEGLLRNQLARLRGSPPTVDQSAIPPHELRAIRAYSFLWVAGRALALASLILVTLPVLVGYGAELARAATGAHSSYSTADLLTLAGLSLGIQGGGLVIWIRSLYLYRNRTQRSSK